MSAKAQFKAALRANDHAGLRAAYAQNPDLIHETTPVGPWLCMAAKSSTLDTMKVLLELGADPNAKDADSRGNALHRAASQGDLEKVKLLRAAGGVFDTSEATANPLFAAIYGRSSDVASYLLSKGLDTRISYEMVDGIQFDALAQALERGERGIASLIAMHLSGQDKTHAQAKLDRAWMTVSARHADAPTAEMPPAPKIEPPYQ